MSSADAATLDRILREYSGFARRVAASHEANPECARDLAQEILVAVWRAWPAFRGDCTERTYVARIAHHRVATHISRAVRAPRFAALPEDVPAASPTPEEQAMRDDQKTRLVELVRTLPIAYREVALLMLEGFTPAEAADTLGVTTNAVAVRASRARDMLRALMEARS